MLQMLHTLVQDAVAQLNAIPQPTRGLLVIAGFAVLSLALIPVALRLGKKSGILSG